MVKILVISDTHSCNKDLIEKIKKQEKADLLFHLGDYAKDGLIIAEALDISSIIVMGNGDHPSLGFKEEEIVEIKGKRILLTHGHKLRVSTNLNKIFYRAKEIEADLVFFGHTHVPIAEKIEDIIFVNPGSPSFPRGYSSKQTYAIVEIDEDIKVRHIEI